MPPSGPRGAFRAPPAGTRQGALRSFTVNGLTFKWLRVGAAALCIYTPLNLAYAAENPAPDSVSAAKLAIDEGTFVNINGMEQWVTIRGQNLSNPVLLYVHGGPGIGSSITAPAFAEWEKHFTFVQWDQPGGGFTQLKNPAAQGAMTIARFTKDGLAV